MYDALKKSGEAFTFFFLFPHNWTKAITAEVLISPLINN